LGQQRAEKANRPLSYLRASRPQAGSKYSGYSAPRRPKPQFASPGEASPLKSEMGKRFAGWEGPLQQMNTFKGRKTPGSLK